jgi:anti-sigma regulatory factor (Ser/Thr protein kinase)
VAFRFPATPAGFEQGFAGLHAELDRHDLPAGTRFSAELVFEEVVANIVRHGVGAADGVPPRHSVEVAVGVEAASGSLVLTFEDDGAAFDPRSLPDPQPARSLEDASVGGRGLMLVRRAASRIDYVRLPEGRNRLTLALSCAAPGN